MKMKTIQYQGLIQSKGEGIYREVNGTIILGVSHNIYIHNLDYHLTQQKIYADGMIDCWNLVTFDTFKEKVKSGWIVTELPKSAEVSVFPLGSFTATNIRNVIKPDELIKEVADIISELNGKPTTSELCRIAYEAYQKEPTEENKLRLKKAYEAIPAHNRIYVLGDQDHKDHAIRTIIYSE